MRFEAPSLNSLKLPLALGLLLGFAWVAYYCFWVQDRARHLTSRNFRLLNAISVQITETVKGRAEVLGRRLGAKVPAEEKSLPKLIPAVPALENVDSLRQLDPKGLPFLNFAYIPFIARDAQAERLEILYYFDAKEPNFLAKLKWHQILQAVLRRESNLEAFDTLLLATSEGQVIYQEGDPSQRLRRLDQLVGAEEGNQAGKKADAKEEKPAAFSLAARSSSSIDVTLSGAPYKLFVQPCCAEIQTQDPREKQPAAGSNLVVCGLISQQRFTASSLSFSYSLLALLAGILLLGVFSWPFLKLSLIGPLQRVRALDVWLLALCGGFALMLVTVLWLDLLAYQGLKHDIEAQLVEYSAGLRANVAEEVREAYQQLAGLEGALPSAQDEWPGGLQGPEYPFFDATLIDGDGMQIRRRSFRWKVSSQLLSVKDRNYFNQVNAGGAWALPAGEPNASAGPRGGAKYVIESIRSWTYGGERAVISKRADVSAPAVPGLCPKGAEGRCPVVALSIPMRSLIKPTILPGFGFAVVDERGDVLFHSDEKRNLIEKFFAESDQGSELAAATLARREKSLNLRYWGRDYLAHIAPLLQGTPWFVITFYEKPLACALNIEWLVTTLLLVSLYAGLYLAVGVVIALTRPGYRAAWLWPDPRRATQYVPLAKIHSLLILAFAAALWFLSGWALLPAAVIISLAAWVITYRRLRGRGEDLQPGKKILLTFSYSVVAVLLLLLTAVLPPAAFFKLAYEAQTETFIKYSQLRLAQALNRPLEFKAVRDEHRDEFVSLVRKFDEKQRDRHTEHFFGTNARVCGPQVECAARMGERHSSAAGVRGDYRFQFLAGALSRFPGLPNLEPSSSLRELLHEKASDGAWDWRREGGSLVMSGRVGASADLLVISSRVPGLGALLWPGRGIELGFLLIVAVAMTVLLALWLVRFFCRRVFLTDLGEPVQVGGGSLRLASGGSLMVIGRPEHLRAVRVPGAVRVDLRRLAAPAANGNGAYGVLRRVIAGTERGRQVFLDRFEYRAEDREFNERVLEVLEELIQVHHRAVVITSPTDPRLLARRAKDQGGNLEERWATLLASFNLIEAKRWLRAVASAPCARLQVGWEWRLSASYRSLLEESKDNRTVRRVVGEYRGRAAVDPDQLWEEVDERLESYFRRLWSRCSRDEQVVLQHLARDGFVNWKARRTVRRLLERGMIRRAPHFVLLNEAFRRFLMAQTLPEVEAAVGAAGGSTWDVIKWPFTAVLLAGLAFFYATQQETINTALTVITGITGAIPLMVKLIGALAGKSASAEVR